MTSTSPLVSVIIPTFNRKDSVRRTLESLTEQTYPTEQFEVIVVDDGGSDDTSSIVDHNFPFTLCYLRQKNQGATAARNTGARRSRGRILVFVDDDIVLYPRALECLVQKLDIPRSIALGTLITPTAILEKSCFAQSRESDLAEVTDGATMEHVPFEHCITGLLAIRRRDFVSLDKFEDPTGGWPNWDDVRFGYRAHQDGYRLVRAHGAIAEHWDYALASLNSACQRWHNAGHSGAILLNRNPGLKYHIPMLQDKGPIAWRRDSSVLILRKVRRQAASSRVVMWVMERAVTLLERRAPTSGALRLLYRWIVSGYIYRGYRKGLREIAERSR